MLRGLAELGGLGLEIGGRGRGGRVGWGWMRWGGGWDGCCCSCGADECLDMGGSRGVIAVLYNLVVE